MRRAGDVAELALALFALPGAFVPVGELRSRAYLR
jgi:hypothetical protein